MFDERLPSVTIKRSLGLCGWFSPLRVFVDGQPVGQVREKRTEEFPVTPGEHLVTVTLAGLYTASVPLKLQKGDRSELICTSNAEPLHPLHLHFLWFCLLWAPLFLLGFFIPSIRALWETLAIEMLVTGVMGWIGMIIFFWRSFKKGLWNGTPTIYLTSALYVDKDGGE